MHPHSDAVHNLCKASDVQLLHAVTLIKTKQILLGCSMTNTGV